MNFEEMTARVRQNLAAWQAEGETAKKLCNLQIKAIVRNYLSSAQVPPDTATLRRLADALLGATTEASTPHATENAGALAFLDALLELYADPFPDERISNPLPLPAGPVTVAHFDSATFADAATRFSPLIGEIVTLPCQSFTEAAEEVANGKASFALLPIEDTAEGKLMRFYEQIDRFELHVIAALDISAKQSDSRVRVALVGKNTLAVDSDEKPHAFECLLFEENNYSLTFLLDAANAMGLSLRRIDSLPISYRDDGFFKHLVFEGTATLCRKLHAYLTLFMPRTSVTADYILIYDHHKELL